MLAKFLRKVPAERFDMSYWGKVENGDLTGKTLCLKRNACGTSACALGWATQVPSFKKAGLKLVVTDVYPQADEAFENFAEVRFGKEKFSMPAARAFFEIGQLESHYLFDPNTYSDSQDIAPREVIVRIAYLLEHGIIEADLAESVVNELSGWSHP